MKASLAPGGFCPAVEEWWAAFERRGEKILGGLLARGSRGMTPRKILISTFNLVASGVFQGLNCATI